MSSMAYNSAAGLQGMLKDGTSHFEQTADEASVVLRNIDACLELSQMLSTSFGPQGRHKLVVNHLGKVLVTSDCASILKEVSVQHPAAQLLSQATQKQQDECGDNTNLCIAFGGQLLYQTSTLIAKMTWQPAPEILAGYQRALTYCLDLAQKQVLATGGSIDIAKRSDLIRLLTPIVASKQYGSEESLAPLVADACLSILDGDKNKSIQPDAIRVSKIIGASMDQSRLYHGFVAQRGLETVLTSATNVQIAVFASGIEASSTDAKGTVLLKNASELLSYNKSEQLHMEETIAAIAATGVRMVVTGGAVSDMALHFLNRYNLLCLKLGSKWELRRLCQAIGATALVRLGPPLPEEIGHASSVRVEQIGSRTVTIVEQQGEGSQSDSKICTILLRASTSSVLNDLERAVHNGVRAVAQAAKDGRLVYGGGAFEMALSVHLEQYANQVPGLEQYALHAFSQALQIIPRTLAENAGWDATRVLADLQAAHASSMTDDSICDVGIDIERDAAAANGGLASMKDKGVVDLLATKLSALKLAVDAVVTILKIDQIIMSKPSGGPKP